MKYDFLIVGMPYSGTQYAARYFQALGFDVGHEVYRKHGTSHSGYLVPREEWEKFPSHKHRVFESIKSFKHRIYIVRDPLKCLSAQVSWPLSSGAGRLLKLQYAIKQFPELADEIPKEAREITHNSLNLINQMIFLLVATNKIAMRELCPNIAVSTERMSKFIPNYLTYNEYLCDYNTKLPPKDVNSKKRRQPAGSEWFYPTLYMDDIIKMVSSRLFEEFNAYIDFYQEISSVPIIDHNSSL